MCETCGCGDGEWTVTRQSGSHSHYHVHRDGTAHAHAHSDAHEHSTVVRDIGGRVLAANDAIAAKNRVLLVDAVVRAKPTGAKGTYLRTFHISSTMGPGVELDQAGTLALASAET